MPLMSPGIQAALRKAGVEKSPATVEETSITDRLENAGLSLENTLGNLATIANGTGNEGLRLRANETALKLHGALKEATVSQIPSFTLVINDPGSAGQGGINPIFLPRQLLNQMKDREQPS